MFKLFTFYLNNSFKETTAYQYGRAIKKICMNEGLTFEQLLSEIDTYIEKYRCEKYEISHYTNVNAIRAFKSFCSWVERNSESILSILQTTP